jgi:hypothetical protein
MLGLPLRAIILLGVKLSLSLHEVRTRVKGIRKVIMKISEPENMKRENYTTRNL